MTMAKVVSYEFLPRVPAFTPLEALTLAKEKVEKGVASCPHHDEIQGMCAHVAACNYGFATCGCTDATSLWHSLPKKYRRFGIERMKEAPAGAVLFWTGGSEGHGHAGLADGRGNVLGTDQPVTGRFGRVPIGKIQDDWGLDPAGWAFPFFELAANDSRKPPKVKGPQVLRTPNIDRFIASQHDAIAAAKRAIVARKRPEDDELLKRLISGCREQIKLADSLRQA